MDACPKCTHPHVVKAGKVRGQQRWLCRGCGYQFTRSTPRGRPPWQQSLAVFLYCHGVSMNALGKDCSQPTRTPILSVIVLLLLHACAGLEPRARPNHACCRTRV